MRQLTKEEYLKIFDSIFEYDIIVKNIAELKSMDLGKISGKEIRELLFEKISILPFLGAELPFSSINLLNTFRARKNIQSEIESLDLVKTYSYPPSTICIVNGRANIKGRSVFYCSDQMMTAVVETKPVKGDMVYLAWWKIQCDRHSIYRAFLSGKLPNINPWYRISIDHQNEFVRMAKMHSPEKADSLIEIFNFLGNLFVEETNPYSLTSWLANNHMYKEEFDFIVYPSFRTDNHTCNIAFHPNYIDQYFRLYKVYKISIQEINESSGTITFNLESIGKLNRTMFNWTSQPDNEDLRHFEREKMRLKETRLFNY